MPEEQHGHQHPEHDSTSPTGGGMQQEALTEDLVRQVSDKVYAMLMQDLAIERERQRPSSRMIGSRGGW